MRTAWLFAFSLTCYAASPDKASVSYIKSFPGSMPAYVSIDIAPGGDAVYKEAVNDDQPIRFQVGTEVLTQILALVEKLGYFGRPLESNLKVANMGQKTFRYEGPSGKKEVQFNYSLDEDARALNDIFERLSETQQYLFILERTVKFDKLGVNKAILQIESALDRNRMVEPSRFLPLLDRVAKNESYLHMARERAAVLADAIRNPKPKAE